MVFLSRIYTKSGDGGETGLGDGSRVSKTDPRIAAIGDVDELNATIGLVIAMGPGSESDLLRSIQNDLFDLGADLCVPESPSQSGVLRITKSQYERLEREIDRLNEGLEPLHSFVLPGGSVASAWLHLARTVCRRAERSVVHLVQNSDGPAGKHLGTLIYLNRLSDLLFVLARTANEGGKADVLWVPGQSRM
jgi:cob(I)alamin adenosyltransferase